MIQIKKEPLPSGVSYPFQVTDYNGMPYRFLGSSGLQVSNVGLGTWKLGYPELGDGSRVDEATAFRLFDKALELGVTHWDTANRYNNGTGNAEVIIGRWLKQHPSRRSDVVIATKVFGVMDGETPNHSGLSRQSILQGVYNCLWRMQTDYVDVLYFHRPDPSRPVEESLETVEDLVRRDLVRYLAVSNFSVQQLEEYAKAAKQLSRRVQVCAVQNNYNILTGEDFSPSVLDYCAGHGLSYIAYSPLARGVLSGKYTSPQQMGATSRMVEEDIADQFDDATFKKVNALIAIANDLGVSLATLSLAYMLTLPGMGPVIPSSSNEKQLEANAQAGKMTLAEDVRKAIAGIVGR